MKLLCNLLNSYENLVMSLGNIEKIALNNLGVLGLVM